MSLIVHVLATRPDAAAIAPVHAALERRGGFRQLLLHTGQDKTPAMVDELLDDLGLPAPAWRLDNTGVRHVTQTAEAVAGASAALAEQRPAVLLVTGAADSTLGCALAAVAGGIPVARLDAGLRERDWRVPAEVNRVLLDHMAGTLFAPGAAEVANLRREGIADERIHLAGSTAIDSLRRALPEARAREVWRRFGLEPQRYVLVTLHRPANVDDDERLARIVEVLATLAHHVPVVFPLHPRTRERLERMGDLHRLLAAGVLCGPPLRYLDFVSLQCGAASVVTDSGLVQEEAAALALRCFTLRASTERATTVEAGTNVLMDGDPRDLLEVVLDGHRRPRRIVPLRDGSAGERVAAVLARGYAPVTAAAS